MHPDPAAAAARECVSCGHADWCFEVVGGQRVCRECEHIVHLTALAGGDRLAALHQRGDELEAFADAQRQALRWVEKNGTDALVAELQEARQQHRRVKLGTINTLVLLAHIDRLEAELAKPPLVLS